MSFTKNLIKKEIVFLKDNMIDSILEVSKIPSVCDETQEGYPFGKDIDDCLRKTLSICSDLGFKTFYNPYYGYAEIGDGEDLVGVLGHLDVVPAGDLSSWDTNPFEPTIKDGKIVCRGIQDNKSSMISCVYGAYILSKIGHKFNKRIRFIFGTDEETLWRDMAKYKGNNEEIPLMGFTPDSTFPITIAEKGLLQCVLKGIGGKINLKAGETFNSVPDKACFNSSDYLVMELDRLGFTYELSGGTVSIIGKAAHSAHADEGIDAINHLCVALKNIGINSPGVQFVADMLGTTSNGELIIMECKDEVSGKLTINLGKIDLSENNEVLSLDVRIPVTIEKDVVVNAIKEKAKQYGLEYEEFDWLAPNYVEANTELVKTLGRVYEQETGLRAELMSSGGATYARALKNCVAFGPVFPYSEQTEHQANEYIYIEDLMKSTEIYAIALYELTK